MCIYVYKNEVFQEKSSIKINKEKNLFNTQI